MSSKGSANTNAQWSADPERGWVRAEERHQRHEESRRASKAKKNGGKHKAKGAKEKSNDQKRVNSNDNGDDGLSKQERGKRS